MYACMICMICMICMYACREVRSPYLQFFVFTPQALDVREAASA